MAFVTIAVLEPKLALAMRLTILDLAHIDRELTPNECISVLLVRFEVINLRFVLCL
jgi:hypothetical protein